MILLPFSGFSGRAIEGHVLPLVKGAQAVGRLASNHRLRLAIGLALRDQQGLNDLLQQIYNPSSPNYHHYLTASEFAARFGPAESDYAKLQDFARSQNLVIEATHPNRTILDLSGSATDIEKAFGLRLQLYQHPNEARTFFAPDSEPVVPEGLAVLHISGLDDFLVPRPAGLSRSYLPPANAKPLSGAGPNGTYRGNDFRGAYARGVTLTGTGQMVGLLEFDGYNLSDILSYETQASVPNVPLSTVTMDDFDGTPSTQNAEVCLDIEMVASMAPGLAAIILYEAGPSGIGNDVLNRMATDNLAKQLSASWTFPIDPTTEQIFQQFAAQGQSYFNASGDGGAYTGPVLSPVDDPNVTVVGGTTLTTTGPGGAWSGETAWNRGTASAASGGGTSTTYRIPSWQSGVNMTANHGSTSMRNLPDVAAVAEGVWITFGNGSNETVGGTSCSAPLWAGFTALVNQQAAGFGRPPVGFLNPALYSLGLSAGYTTNFHDIVIGNNTNSSSPTQYNAVIGYDLCTGWGSPFGQNLINALAPRAPGPLLTNVSATLIFEGCSPANKAIDPGETVTVSFAMKNIGGVKTTNLLATLISDGGVRWPSAGQSYGSLLPGGTAVSRNFTFTAAGQCGDNLSATLQLQDGAVDLGKLVFTFPLGVPNLVFTQNFDSVPAPALPTDWTTMASNGVSGWVTSTNLHDSSPDAVFADEPPSPGAEDLISPAIPISSTAAQLTFRQSYNTETDPAVATEAYDGGFLEVKIGTNDFADIITAGGSFVTGGYNHSISTSTNSDNPFRGHGVWGGNSGGFRTTVVNLPATAAGESIQLRWRFALDTGNFYGGFGWYIDSVAIRDGTTCCNPSADLQIVTLVTPEPVDPGQPLTYSIMVSNLGPGSAYGATVTNVLPTNVMFGFGSPGCAFTNGLVLCDVGTLSAGAVSNFTFLAIPTSLESITNVSEIWAFTPDPDLSNNQLITISTVATNTPPVVSVQITNIVAPVGGTALLQATAIGVEPLAFQWLYKGGVIAGQNSASLVLTNLQVMQSGNYALLVTNINGATQSADIQLTVTQPPTIQATGITPDGGTFAMSLMSVAGVSYLLEYKSALADPAWTSILPAIRGTGDIVSLMDTNASGVASRFYRVRAQ